MSVKSTFFPVLVSVALVGGCYEGVSGDGETQFRKVTTNAPRLNRVFNAVSLFGLGPVYNSPFFEGGYFSSRVGGSIFNGTRIDGIVLDGEAVETLDVHGSELEVSQVIDGEEVVREGEAVVGMVISMTVEGTDEKDNEGSIAMDMRIDDVLADPDAATDDVMLYYVSVSTDGGDKWEDPCVDDEGTAQPVIFLRNYWDEETGDRIDDSEVLTMACTTGVLAHCAQWGYRPWAEVEDCNKKGKKCKDRDLKDYHQACTRMARADYCGTGEPWTVAGTELDIWDDLNPQINGRAVDWDIEGEWTPDGAWCLNDIRQQKWKEEGLYPSCSKKMDKKWEKRANKCGKLKNKGSLLVSSFNGDA